MPRPCAGVRQHQRHAGHVDGGQRLQARRARISSSTRRPWLPAPRRSSGSAQPRRQRLRPRRAGARPSRSAAGTARPRRARPGVALTIATSTWPSATRRAASTEWVVVISKRSGSCVGDQPPHDRQQQGLAQVVAGGDAQRGHALRRQLLQQPLRAKTPRRTPGSGPPAPPRPPGWAGRRVPRFRTARTPKRCSMRRSCCDTADGVLCSRRAASPTDEVWATTSASCRAGIRAGSIVM